MRRPRPRWLWWWFHPRPTSTGAAGHLKPPSTAEVDARDADRRLAAAARAARHGLEQIRNPHPPHR